MARPRTCEATLESRCVDSSALLGSPMGTVKVSAGLISSARVFRLPSVSAMKENESNRNSVPGGTSDPALLGVDEDAIFFVSGESGDSPTVGANCRCF